MGTIAKGLGIDRLSMNERMQLVEEIWESILEESNELELPESHRAELDRRLEAREANPGAGSTWEVVESRLLRKSEETR